MRKALVTGAALVVVAAGVIAVEIQHARTRDYLPSDPGFDVDVTAGTEHPGVPLEVAILGDSLVAGLGADSPRGTLGGHIATQLAKQLERPVHVIGYGVSGAVTADVLHKQVEQVRDGVDVIVIEIGSNDVTHLTALDSVERDTERMLEASLERAPIVVLGSAGKMNSENFLRPLRDAIVWRASKVRERQWRAARRAGVPFMNVAREVSPAYADAAPQSASSDEFHPSELGYEIWARPLVSRIVGALNRAS